MTRIKGILFDLGDTLLDFGPVDTLKLFVEGARLAYAYLQQLGQPVPPFAKYHRRQLRAVQWSLLKSHLTRREFNSLDVLVRTSKSMGQKLTPEQTEELAWLWYEPLSRCVTVEDRLEELLEGFRRNGLSLAVISNTFVPGQVLDRHMAELGLLEYFPVRIYSCDVRYRKPHPKIFQICLDRLGISPSEAIFVGDKLRPDITGAAQAGIISVLKDPSGARRNHRIRPDHRITTLRQLPEIVAGYNSH
ncbi:MAG: HAD family hydrolase [Planctomycetota bacterium]|nr:HAD family hydrolase [Planctomycetota bacterium]